MKSPLQPRGFALVVTLAILVAICIIIVAFVTTMRTERTASYNDAERRLAQGLAQSTLNRLLADSIGAFPSYKVDPVTKLPTAETDSLYNADEPEKGLFRIEPQSDISTANHLVRLSRVEGGGGVSAYTPQDWAYLRLKDFGTDFIPKNVEEVATTPQWIDYYPIGENGQRATVPTGQIAFAIWEEGGKFDINMAGEDSRINGLAPHNLAIEDFASGGTSSIATALLDYLNGSDSVRKRSNFSLRDIVDGTGDDRRIFSIEELLRKGLVSPDKAINLTTFSRDFDVRPEWDGSREAATAKDFLRSYVNNPDIYRLMAGAAGSAGPALVKATMDESVLRSTLSSAGFPVSDSWMQIMRLLSSMRLALPPYTSAKAPSNFTAISATAINPNLWYDEDIWGIALNIAQASDSVADEPLIAQDRSGPLALNEQPNVRYGTRLSPYITEIAIKVAYAGPNTVSVTEYVEMWNPYPIDLSGYTYIYGESSGGVWPAFQGGLKDRTNFRKIEAGPLPGGFKTFEFTHEPSKVLTGQSETLAKSGGEFGFMLRIAPYLTQTGFYNQTGTSGKPWEYRFHGGPHYSGSTWANYMLLAWIPPSRLPKSATDPAVWYSFQIDDPRMGAVTRFDPNWKQTWTAPGEGSKVTGNWKFSWQGYFNQHSLYGITDGPKQTSPQFGDGYNQNFGDNWPANWPKTQEGLNRALATFAAPGRPLRGAGEVGNVFAFRPWRTLTFSKSIAPSDTSLPKGAAYRNWTTTMLDYLTTVGTTSESQNLNYRSPGNAPSPGFVEANLLQRKQDFRWLFESVNVSGEPAGNLRPIRGRVNLNTANEDTLTAMLKAPYRVVNNLGVRNWPGLNATEVGLGPLRDLQIEIPESDARNIAQALIATREKRPLRSLADLAELYEESSIKNLYNKYPDAVMNAVMGRLAQFGTIRQQIYTIDIMARTLNPIAKAKGKDVVTAEVRMLARVYFDTFSRQAFVESMEYR